MISAIFTSVGSVITGFTTALISAFGGIGDAIYSGESLTTLGLLLMLGLGMGLVYWAFRVIRGLVKTRG